MAKPLTKAEQAIIWQFRLVGLISIGTLGFGAVFYHIVEKLNWLDAVYFCTITLTSIGYGDIVPHTDLGKLFTIFYALAGIGIIAAFANLALKRTVTRRHIREERKELEKA